MNKKYLWFAVAVLLCAGAWVALSYWSMTTRAYSGPAPVWLHIPGGLQEEALQDSLKSQLGSSYGKDVYETWQLLRANPVKAHGAYLINPGDRAIDIAQRLRAGLQTPVNVTFNNIRLIDELYPKVSDALEFSAADFKSACDTVLTANGFDRNNFIGAFLPDSYQFYWTATPASVVNRLLGYRNDFWNQQRREKAAKLGLTPEQITVVASIVEEESANRDEYPVIGRLYINRLKKGMKLQADPTVKYAVGDFALRRILKKHLDKQSPYNTYQVDGLPPGPIRMPEKSTIDAILNSAPNNYLYMCAKEDFSGRHNFATSLAQHNENARRYRAALDARGIK